MYLLGDKCTFSYNSMAPGHGGITNCQGISFKEQFLVLAINKKWIFLTLDFWQIKNQKWAYLHNMLDSFVVLFFPSVISSALFLIYLQVCMHPEVIEGNGVYLFIPIRIWFQWVLLTFAMKSANVAVCCCAKCSNICLFACVFRFSRVNQCRKRLSIPNKGQMAFIKNHRLFCGKLFMANAHSIEVEWTSRRSMYTCRHENFVK